MSKLQEIAMEQELRGFSGTTAWYPFHSLYLTDGTRYLAEQYDCYWLMTIIWSIPPKVRDSELLVCSLLVKDNGKALFTAMREKKTVYKQPIPHTDFPARSVTVWVLDRVILLPSEY